MFSECLVYCSMHLGVPFIVPRQLGAVGDQLGRQFLPSVGWCTRQSGAPSDMNSTCPVLDLLPFLVKLTVGSLVPLAHRTLSGAHRTVRCDHPTVGSPTCRPLIAQTTVGHDAFSFSRERRVRRRRAWVRALKTHWTVWCTTGKSDDL
jgi:hypothetical protein